MKSFPVAVLTLSALSLLTACSPKGGGAAANSNGATASNGAAPAASGPDVEVKMSDLPRPRAGLWKIVIDDGDGKPTTMTTCHSGKQPEIPKMPTGCSQFSIKRTFLGSYVMDMNCVTPQFSMTSHSTATGDFQGHVVGDGVLTMSGKGMPARTIKTHTEETWVGPCAPGQQPDDEKRTNAG